jgi:hypothetical protein
LIVVFPAFRQRFVIRGSDYADGQYNVASGDDLNLEAAGSSWTFGFEIEPLSPVDGQPWAAPTEQIAQKGFGTELIEREVGSTVDAHTKYEYRDNGLSVAIAIPLDPGQVSLRREDVK